MLFRSFLNYYSVAFNESFLSENSIFWKSIQFSYYFFSFFSFFRVAAALLFVLNLRLITRKRERVAFLKTDVQPG